ncbi:MAG TPA: isoprenylcysteine carboxylmethyltransferase family protein [Candidatus Hydrogenedentes bacterium]|nr:isoprenylcysteine carboxylmethyltransferase family protein [Candidatus Hydrogenedentota bacterium]
MLESKIAAYTIMVLAGLFGWVSLLVFMVFLFVGSLNIVSLGFDTRSALWLDAGLCLLFFVQHSVMVRKFVRRWQAKLVPEEYGAAIYAIFSGLVLLAMVVFWQSVQWPIIEFHGVYRIPFRALFLLSVAGFAWGVRSFKSFDPFGVSLIRHRLRGTQPRPQPFVAVGPYRWVRHPLYLFMLFMIWSCPALTMDRLMFNLLWTVWIGVVGTILEERDLVAEFGDIYREYQRKVPMLIPFRIPPPVESHNKPDGD